MKDMRCPECGKLLGKLEGLAEIKCNRCKKVWLLDSKQNITKERH